MESQYLLQQPKKLNNLLKLFKNDIVFTASILLAVLSCLLAQPKLSYINLNVLVCLFNLMVVIKAFEELKLLDKLAVSLLIKYTDSRRISLVLILLSFFTSMLITNDIALITLVPLALIIGRKTNTSMLYTIILQTLAANIGSSLTPMGNPQNLFIFSYYRLSAASFFLTVIFFVGTGLFWLLALNYKNKKTPLDIEFEKVQIKDRRQSIVWTILFVLIILSIFEVVPYLIVFTITVITAFTLDHKLIRKVDYPLLLTFVCFFIFIGNLSSIPAVSNFMKGVLNSRISTFFGSILLSQLISNVPCAIFLSKFTDNWRELLLGVNIGGMGTIIASLASIISYKLFIKEYPEQTWKYLIKFSLYNVFGLSAFTLVNYFVILGK